MKLSVGLIVLAAMLSLATARPSMGGPIMNAGHQFATEAHTFAPGAGRVEGGARLTAPPSRFMAPAPELRDGFEKTPRPSVAEEATHAQESHDFMPPSLTHSLLYLTRPSGTPFAFRGVDGYQLRDAAEVIRTAHSDDITAQTLSESLIKLANEIVEQNTMTQESTAGFRKALAEYFTHHSAITADLEKSVARLRAHQMDILPNEIHMLHQHRILQDQKLEQLQQFLQAIFSAVPDDTKAAIQKNMQNIANTRREKEARFRQEELARVNDLDSRARGDLPYGHPSQAPGPPSLQKEKSHESIYTQSGANPAVNAHSNNPSGARNGFQPTPQSTTDERAVPNSHFQPTEGQSNGMHEAPLADRKAAIPATTQDHVADDGEDQDWENENYWDDEDLDDEDQHYANEKNAYDFEPTKPASADGLKNVEPKSVKTNDGDRHISIPSENGQPSRISATAA